MTGAAVADALLAVVFATALAVRQVVGVSSATAVVAALTAPLVQRHVRTARVVGGQHATHQAKRIGQSALFERSLDGHGSVAGAEHVAIDVRVRHRPVRGRRLGVQGHHLEAMAVRLPGQALPGQADGERPQVDLFQLDGLGGDAQRLLLEVDVQAAELVLKLPQFTDQVAQVGCRGVGPPEFVAGLLDGLLDGFHQAMQMAAHGQRAGKQARGSGLAQTSAGALQGLLVGRHLFQERLFDGLRRAGEVDVVQPQGGA